ncbi:hypothetical protein Bca52824_061967 [Brassica carinata]|uniref:Uncharacterized protein n=1 Tax=Brassica carinata TaxID=52824 RepID=A0A8X7QC11_BRACI|nr:hypothetical protein Bca52824_061967 [Brassica carinata]
MEENDDRLLNYWQTTHKCSIENDASYDRCLSSYLSTSIFCLPKIQIDASYGHLGHGSSKTLLIMVWPSFIAETALKNGTFHSSESCGAIKFIYGGRGTIVSNPQSKSLRPISSLWLIGTNIILSRKNKHSFCNLLILWIR